MPMFPNLLGNVSVLLKFVFYPQGSSLYEPSLLYRFSPHFTICFPHTFRHTIRRLPSCPAVAFLSTSFLSKVMAFFVIQCYNIANVTVWEMMQSEGGRYNRRCVNAEL